MYPRPRSRKKPLTVVPVAELVADVERIKPTRDPVAIVTGRREWALVRDQREWRKHGAFWPGGEETFMDVPVVIHRYASAPRVIATMEELEEALLGGPD